MLNFPPTAGPLIVTYGDAELPELRRVALIGNWHGFCR